MQIALRIRDVLEKARNFHIQLAQFYEQRQAAAGNEKLKVLLNYMQRHEKNLAETLARFSHEAAQRLLDTWLSFVPDDAMCECVKELTIPPGASIDEVVRLALRLDQCLVQLYTQMAERAPTREVRELFLALLREEQKERIHMLRNALTMEEEL